jgi:hypothetical protein
MVQQCAACNFAADTEVVLPEPWTTYLVRECGVTSDQDCVTIPVCVGCQRTIESFLDPRDPTGGKDPDTAVRTFLHELTLQE